MAGLTKADVLRRRAQLEADMANTPEPLMNFGPAMDSTVRDLGRNYAGRYGAAANWVQKLATGVDSPGLVGLRDRGRAANERMYRDVLQGSGGNPWGAALLFDIGNRMAPEAAEAALTFGVGKYLTGARSFNSFKASLGLGADASAADVQAARELFKGVKTAASTAGTAGSTATSAGLDAATISSRTAKTVQYMKLHPVATTATALAFLGPTFRKLGSSFGDYLGRKRTPLNGPTMENQRARDEINRRSGTLQPSQTATPYQPTGGIGPVPNQNATEAPQQPQDIARMLQEAYQQRFGPPPQEGGVGWGFRLGPSGYKPNYAGDYRAQVLGPSANEPRLNRQYAQQMMEEQAGMANAGQYAGLIGQLGMTNLTRDQQAMLQRQMTRDDVERGRAPLIRQVASERTQRLIDKANAKASMRGPAGFSIDKTAAAYVANEGLDTDSAYQKAIEQYQTLRQ